MLPVAKTMKHRIPNSHKTLNKIAETVRSETQRKRTLCEVTEIYGKCDCECEKQEERQKKTHQNRSFVGVFIFSFTFIALFATDIFSMVSVSGFFFCRLTLCHQPHYRLFHTLLLLLLSLFESTKYVHCLLMYNLTWFIFARSYLETHIHKWIYIVVRNFHESSSEGYPTDKFANACSMLDIFNTL